jgi:MATE family multidrug resistance protein
MDLVDRMLSEFKIIGRLAVPLIVGQVSQVGMGFTDTVMAGRLSAADLAAVAIGTSLWIPIYLASVGIMMALSPSIAHMKGGNRVGAIGPLFRQGLWLALLLACVAVPLTRYIGQVTAWLDIDPAIVPVTNEYLAALSWGMPAACAYLAPRFLSEGIGHTKPIMCIQLAGLAVNAVGNYILMYGKLGAPAMGAVGAGWSSAIVLWTNATLIFLYVGRSRRYDSLQLFHPADRPDGDQLAQLLRLGVPIATSMVMEVGLFTAVSLLMGSLGTVAVAAHQIALNYAALAFMVPLGMSMAITIRVGHVVGAGDLRRARLAGLVGMGMAVTAMVVSATVMLCIPERIVGMYTQDRDVANLAISLLFVAALFQISDGLQVSAFGALRGLKDSRVPMYITFFAYWIVGLPLAYLLGINEALGPRGLWTGLVFGLTVAALLLSVRFHVLSKRDKLVPAAAS